MLTMSTWALREGRIDCLHVARCDANDVSRCEAIGVQRKHRRRDRRVSTYAVRNVRDLWCGHQGPQPPRLLGSAELSQRLSLDLPDPLARDIELLADLFEGVLALAADAEAQPDDLLFSRREDLQDAGGFVAHVPFVDGVHRRADRAIFDQVAERRI